MKLSNYLLWLLICILLVSCQSETTVGPPEIEFQEVALSLSTIDPKEQLDLFAYDHQAPLEVLEIERWEQQGVSYIDLTYASPTGNRVPATLILPKGSGPFAGLIIQHGMPSNRQAMYGVGQAYAQTGAVVIMIDAPWARPERQECEGYSCETVPRFTEEDRSDQIELMLDLQRAVDLLMSRPEVNPQCLGYIGVSYGGAMGGLFAGIEQRLKAYVLVVGDGGLVEHTSEPDAAGYPDHWSENWVSAMWPIEPLHYVGMASPAALLFQNGTQDKLVPPSDALRYQQAGSEPKTVMWYEAGHGLPFESLQDQSEWLYQTLGPACFNFSQLNFSATSTQLDSLIIAWLLLVGISMILIFLDMALGTPQALGTFLIWELVVIFLGPAGFLVYWITWRHPLRSPDPISEISVTKLALGSTVWAVAANLLGGIFVIWFLLSYPDIYTQSILLQIGFSVLIPLVTGLLVFNLVCLLSTLGSKYRINLKKPLFAEILSTCLVLAGAYPVVIILINKWLDFLYPFGWDLTTPLLWIIFSLGAVASSILAFPAHYWLIRSKIILWGYPLPAAESDALEKIEPQRLRWYQTVGLVLVAVIVMMAGITIANLLVF